MQVVVRSVRLLHELRRLLLKQPASGTHVGHGHVNSKKAGQTHPVRDSFRRHTSEKQMKPIAFLLGAACLVAADRSPEAQAWWSHVESLASDAMEGRRPGTPGYNKAAEYVAAKFEQMGLKPGGTNGGYAQPVAMESSRSR